ncbi:hypothetical protein BH11ACT3_BH11ACT3_02730 [soil metagenome]
MSILHTVPEDEATGVVAELYAHDVESLGYVPPHTKAMALNPEAQRAFEALVDAIRRPLGTRRYRLVTLAAAGALGSQACRLAHGRMALKHMDADEVLAVARDFHAAGLSEAEVAMMDFAATLSGDSASMTDADSQRLRDVGFTDEEIVSIALAAGVRNYYSRVLHALAVDVDVPPGLTPELQEALRA